MLLHLLMNTCVFSCKNLLDSVEISWNQADGHWGRLQNNRKAMSTLQKGGLLHFKPSQPKVSVWRKRDPCFFRCWPKTCKKGLVFFVLPICLMKTCVSSCTNLKSECWHRRDTFFFGCWPKNNKKHVAFLILLDCLMKAYVFYCKIYSTQLASVGLKRAFMGGGSRTIKRQRVQIY